MIAPSGPVGGPEAVKIAADSLQKLGYRVKAGTHCGGKYGYLAGSDRDRAEDINRMFADPDVDAVICLMGGYGTMRILDRLDYGVIAANPKIFVGYSDITGLHVALNRLCGLVTFHGPMPVSDAECYTGEDAFSRNGFFDAITSAAPLGVLSNPPGEPVRQLAGGRAEGEIVGGNLSLVAATVGTPYEIDAKGKILFLEDVGEAPYRVDRMLTQLRLSGKFRECSGVVLGSWTGCEPDGPDSLSLAQVFEDVVAPCGKPAVLNLRAGHCSPKVTVPFGVDAVLDADAGTLEIMESAVV